MKKAPAKVMRLGINMTLLLVIHSLSCGGAERVLSALANAWSEQGHALVVATMDDSAPFYPLAPSVRLPPSAPRLNPAQGLCLLSQGTFAAWQHYGVVFGR